MTYSRPGVYINETLLPAPITSTGTANAAGAAIGAFSQGPSALTLVTSWYDFVKKFGGFNQLFPATLGVNQFFANGGTELYVKRVISSALGSAAAATLPSTVSGVSIGTVTAKTKGIAGNTLRVMITRQGSTNFYTLTVYQEVIVGGSSTDATADLLLESYDNLVFNDVNSPDYASTVVNAFSSVITLTLVGPTGIPATYKTPATQTITAVIPLSGAKNFDDTASLTVDPPIAAAAYSAVFATDGTSELDSINRPLVVFAPELYAKLLIDAPSTAAADLTTVHEAMISWANSGNGFAVLGTAPGLSTLEAIAYATARSVSSQAAVYYPNYYVTDPLSTRKGALRLVSPSSAAAALYLATDKLSGPFKAPAGIGARINTAISLERAFTSVDLDQLNTGNNGTTIGKPVNVVRNVPGAGIVVMGARTLKQDGTANRYVNMRRSLIYIKKRMEDLTSFAVFQNNDYKLWAQLRTTITVFLNEYRNQGGLAGATPAQSFYVKVDSENNTPTSIATGAVNIEVGVALQYPAEFVVINLSQITGN